MKYYLRVEGMNLGSFVKDTNDLATIRGGSLLLLEAMDLVEKIIIDTFPGYKSSKENITSAIENIIQQIQGINHDTSLSKSEKKRKKQQLRKKKKALKEYSNPNNDSCLATISKGASWGLFELDESRDELIDLQKKIIEQFNDENGNYKHATIMVDLYQETDGEGYQISRDKVQTLNRWQQLQAPSLGITLEGDTVCAIDQIRPASQQVKWKNETVYISESVHRRRKYGVEEKKNATFYKSRGALAEDSTRKLTHDFEELSCNPPKYATHLDGKIAFIYIDGNSFGEIQRDSEDPDQQRAFDSQTREGRKQVLRDIVAGIQDKPDWLNNSHLRLETLLWGGDEIIWVVPAWQGWWMLNRFYQLAEKNISYQFDRNGQQVQQRLYHGSAIIFCHHNAPIHRIDGLARNLADDFAKEKKFKEKNMVAYQVLESFDHVGADLKTHRQERLQGLADDIDHLLVDAASMGSIRKTILKLKKNSFPTRKIYQIVQAFRDETDPENKRFSKKLYKKLTGENKGDSNSITEEQKVFKSELNHLRKIWGNSDAFWLHLMELWDYVGLDEN